jgi:RimJ/RimL family protein N-acetyltransferase
MLQTSRLILRDLVAEDFAAVHAYASNPLVTRYMSFARIPVFS